MNCKYLQILISVPKYVEDRESVGILTSFWQMKVTSGFISRCNYGSFPDGTPDHPKKKTQTTLLTINSLRLNVSHSETVVLDKSPILIYSSSLNVMGTGADLEFSQHRPSKWEIKAERIEGRSLLDWHKSLLNPSRIGTTRSTWCNIWQ